MMEELRIVDPNTGGAKGTKIARFSLIPSEFLWALAEHYGKGARKYARYGECSCAKIARSLEKLIQDNVAVLAMKYGYEEVTLNMLKDNDKTLKTGLENIQIRNCVPNAIITADRLQNAVDLQAATDSVWKSTIQLYPNLVDFVEKPTSLDILITTMKQVISEVLSATDAILALDLLKSGVIGGHTKHWPGCPALKLIVEGDRNWERGYKWSLSVDALQRHLHQWLMGEDNDQETDQNHLIAVAWHACALYIFELRRLGTDDIRTRW